MSRQAPEGEEAKGPGLVRGALQAWLLLWGISSAVVGACALALRDRAWDATVWLVVLALPGLLSLLLPLLFAALCLLGVWLLGRLAALGDWIVRRSSPPPPPIEGGERIELPEGTLIDFGPGELRIRPASEGGAVLLVALAFAITGGLAAYQLTLALEGALFATKPPSGEGDLGGAFLCFVPTALGCAGLAWGTLRYAYQVTVLSFGSTGDAILTRESKIGAPEVESLSRESLVGLRCAATEGWLELEVVGSEGTLLLWGGSPEDPTPFREATLRADAHLQALLGREERAREEVLPEPQEP